MGYESLPETGHRPRSVIDLSPRPLGAVLVVLVERQRGPFADEPCHQLLTRLRPVGEEVVDGQSQGLDPWLVVPDSLLVIKTRPDGADDLERRGLDVLVTSRDVETLPGAGGGVDVENRSRNHAGEHRNED